MPVFLITASTVSYDTVGSVVTSAVWESRLTSKDLTPRWSLAREFPPGKKIDHTFQSLQDPLHSTGTAAAAHRDVELVLVVRHGWSGRVGVSTAGGLRGEEKRREREERKGKAEREDDGVKVREERN